MAFLSGFWVTEWNYWGFSPEQVSVWAKDQTEVGQTIHELQTAGDDISIEETEKRRLDDKNSRKTNKAGEEKEERGKTPKNHLGKANTACS